MMMKQNVQNLKLSPKRAGVSLAVLLACLLVTLTPYAGLANDTTEHKELQKRRLERRKTQLSYNQDSDKSGSPAHFGLLVIPVDFADNRFAANRDLIAELSPRLYPNSGESLHNYFRIASGNRLDLKITTAPVIHLSGDRLDYSDVGYNGFFRTRALATEAITAVKNLGLEFRKLDTDGPDLIPGSADDDGEVDGVLILHAGVGQENDLDSGLIQALQYFLDEPVESEGIEASFYSVASINSGLGIWAHETAHLLGFEERYDKFLGVDDEGSEPRSRGGLGKFSVMSSGAWGAGGGHSPALPDAYSCLQMGWINTRQLPVYGSERDTLTYNILTREAARIWTNGEIGPEYFLLETRDPTKCAPFDVGISANQLLVYHIDETVIEGAYGNDAGGFHLRVKLVEADDLDDLFAGESPGSIADLFPGTLDVTQLTPLSSPSSHGYSGTSHISIEEITSLEHGVSFSTSASSSPAIVFYSEFSEDEYPELSLTANSTGTLIDDLFCTIVALGSEADGTFNSGELSISVELVETQPGQWQPANSIVWIPGNDVPNVPSTRFRYVFTTTQWTGEAVERTWFWDSNAQALDFVSNWPDQWIISNTGAAPQTTWFRWGAAPWLTTNQSPVLACVSEQFDSSADFPNVTYSNAAYTELISGYVGSQVKGIRLVHAIEAEMYSATLALDGAVVSWLGPDGEEIPTSPVDGWESQSEPRSDNQLLGQDCLANDQLSIENEMPLWRTDLFAVPQTAGPWRLKLAFGSNPLWRRMGWFIADIEPVYEDLPSSAFVVNWTAGNGQHAGLSWTWPYVGATQGRYLVQYQDYTSGLWQTIVDRQMADPFVAAAEIFSHLPSGTRRRYELRVIGISAWGQLSSRNITVYRQPSTTASVTLSQPWPNPAVNMTRFMVSLPTGEAGKLQIYDLRGRQVYKQDFAAGSFLFTWDGCTKDGTRLAAGSYYIRLEGSNSVSTRKVVLLH